MVDHTVLNCDCGLRPDEYNPMPEEDISRNSIDSLHEVEFFDPAPGSAWATKFIGGKNGTLRTVYAPEVLGEPRVIKCIECKEEMRPGDTVEKLWVDTRPGCHIEFITCLACASIRNDFIGDGGHAVGNLRTQIYVCLGFDYLGDEDWKPDFDNMPDSLQALYERLKGGQK